MRAGNTFPWQVDLVFETSEISFLSIKKVYQQVHMTYLRPFVLVITLSSRESLHTRAHTPLLTETFLGEFGGPFHGENKHKPRGQETWRLWGPQCLRRECPCPFWTQRDCYGRDTIIWTFSPKRLDFRVNLGDRKSPPPHRCDQYSRGDP